MGDTSTSKLDTIKSSELYIHITGNEYSWFDYEHTLLISVSRVFGNVVKEIHSTCGQRNEQ